MERITRLDSGNYVFVGEELANEAGVGYGEAAVLIDRHVVHLFLEKEINRLADERLKIMIELQRHTLEPEKGEGA